MSSDDISTSVGSDTNARIAGALLIVTALATLVAVVGRVAADADYPTLAESLYAISLKKELYGIGGAGRLLSGITLIAGAWYLAKTWIIRERLGTPLVPVLFALSGAFTAVSGACAVGLALFGPGIEVFESVEGMIESTAFIRWITGKIGFSAAGLALIVAARYQWKVGGTLRFVAPASLIIGVAMQLIWIDSAIFVHRVSGSALLVWLLLIGTMLFSGRVERHFEAMISKRPTA